MSARWFGAKVASLKGALVVNRPKAYCTIKTRLTCCRCLRTSLGCHHALGCGCSRAQRCMQAAQLCILSTAVGAAPGTDCSRSKAGLRRAGELTTSAVVNRFPSSLLLSLLPSPNFYSFSPITISHLPFLTHFSKWRNFSSSSSLTFELLPASPLCDTLMASPPLPLPPAAPALPLPPSGAPARTETGALPLGASGGTPDAHGRNPVRGCRGHLNRRISRCMAESIAPACPPDTHTHARLSGLRAREGKGSRTPERQLLLAEPFMRVIRELGSGASSAFSPSPWHTTPHIWPPPGSRKHEGDVDRPK